VAEMVLPMGGPMDGGGGSTLPPPPELLRFKPGILGLGICYAALLLLSFISGSLSNSFNYMFMTVVTLVMYSRANECMMQCLLPFTLFCFLNVLMDAINLIGTLARPYPSADDFFSSSCAMNRTVILLQGTKVYDLENKSDYLVPARTKVEAEFNLCSWHTVLGNIVLILGLALDIFAANFAWKMVKAMRPPEGGGGLLSSFSGSPGPLPGPGGPGRPGGAGPELLTVHHSPSCYVTVSPFVKTCP